MTLAQRVDFIIQQLDSLYPNPQIPLSHSDPFTLLVAVVLSAQCTDRRVNSITPQLFDLASDPAAMAALPVETVQAIIRPCGLSAQKSQAIVGLSKLLLERHNGQVPADFAALEALPGVGHKTASVLMSQAFGQPAFPVDTHIHRLMTRWGLSDGSSVTHSERAAKRLFPEEKWHHLHLQMIYFGREHCPARAHNAQTCPICSRLD